ncbi:hypothetical protein [Bacillus horti]|uniref:ABC transporter permease n=1 Tax=Caldalkalibacillus horti TaxID=77523 RepID=A0ABT9VXQ8_9BACI|nr:hypothetical protein [Bacillus horti]MDQ0165778.1 hypothetical protein [Bacillus horti]
MQNIKGVMTLHWIDLRKSLVIFWSILILFTLVALLFTLTVGNRSIMMSGNIAAYVYLGITGFISIREIFSYALGFGSTRKNYMIGTFYTFTILAFFMTILQSIYHHFGEWLFGFFGVAPSVEERKSIFLSMYSFVEGDTSFLLIFLLDFFLALLILIVGHFIGSLLFRFGSFITLSLIGLIVVSAITPGVNSIWVNMFEYLFLSNPNWIVHLNILVPLISLILLLINWGFMRSCPTHK